MPKTKQTARKTTGTHLALTSALSRTRPAPAESGKPKSKPKRMQHRLITATSNGPSGARSKLSPTKSILKRPNTAMSSPPGSGGPVSVPPTTNLSPTRFNVPLSTGGGISFAKGTAAPASGTLIRRRPAVSGLDIPISVCARFATWLENQKSVHDETLLRAVERDGSHFLSLAKATVMFDNALRGHVTPTLNGAISPLIEHARTLRVFAELLKSKISEGSLSEELETAVLRDGEALLRLAISCLEFDQAVQGSDTAQVK